MTVDEIRALYDRGVAMFSREQVAALLAAADALHMAALDALDTLDQAAEDVKNGFTPKIKRIKQSAEYLRVAVWAWKASE